MYAWIRQMANSNRIYPLDVSSRNNELIGDDRIAAPPYVPTNDRTMWPAVIFAASRNDSVRGRTSTLVDSMRTRNGFSQSGAPSGRKCAVVFLGAYRNLEMIILSHNGNPIVKVMIKWLDSLNVYGNIPIRLITIRVTNSGATIDDSPLRDLAPVRINCENIVSSGIVVDIDHRFRCAYDLFIRTENRIILVRRNIVVQRMKKFDDAGSKVEKMSGIIQDSGLESYLRLWRSLV